MADLERKLKGLLDKIVMKNKKKELSFKYKKAE